MEILDSKEICVQIEEEVKQFAKTCIIRPSVAVITIGNDPLNELFVKEREEACNRAGIYFRYYNFEDSTPELTIINKIKELNNDDYVNGIMVDTPIPDKYNEKRLNNTIINSKDINGVTDINVGRLLSGRKTIMPCAAEGIYEILKKYNIEISGKEITIVGNDKIIVRPLANVFFNLGATVTVCNTNTKNIEKYTKDADIVISSANAKSIIKENMIKEGAVVIDAGYSYKDGKINGDVDYSKVSKKASYITPNKERITDIAIAMFLKNIIFCYKNKK